MSQNASPNACRKYRQRLKTRAVELIGDKCVFCGWKEGLEMAHVKETKLSGSSARGMGQRYIDVIKNPDAYRRMCRRCHRVFDQLAALRVPERVEDVVPF